MRVTIDGARLTALLRVVAVPVLFVGETFVTKPEPTETELLAELGAFAASALCGPGARVAPLGTRPSLAARIRFRVRRPAQLHVRRWLLAADARVSEVLGGAVRIQTASGRGTEAVVVLPRHGNGLS